MSLNTRPTFPQRSRSLLLTTAACAGLDQPLIADLEGLPSSLVQLRSAVWTGDTRDTKPISDIRRWGYTPRRFAAKPARYPSLHYQRP